MPRLTAMTLAGLLAAIAIAAAACGGGGDDSEASLQEYFTEFQTASDAVTARFEALFTDFGVAFDESATEQERLDAAPQFAAEFVAIIEFASSELRDLDPPAEVADAHDEFAEAVDGFRDQAEALADRISEAETAADLDALFSFEDSPEFDAADQRLNEACTALEQLAADNDIAVDLDCEEE